MSTLDELRKNFPKDVDILIPVETTSVVQVSIKEVVITLLEALTLVVIVVFLFLQNWRATLIPVLAIPGIPDRNVYLFYSIWIYNQYADVVCLCVVDRYCGR